MRRRTATRHAARGLRRRAGSSTNRGPRCNAHGIGAVRRTRCAPARSHRACGEARRSCSRGTPSHAILAAPEAGAPDGWGASLDAGMDRVLGGFLARIERRPTGPPDARFRRGPAARARVLGGRGPAGDPHPRCGRAGARRARAGHCGDRGVPRAQHRAPRRIARGGAVRVPPLPRGARRAIAGARGGRAGRAAPDRGRVGGTVPRRGERADWSGAHPTCCVTLRRTRGRPVRSRRSSPTAASSRRRRCVWWRRCATRASRRPHPSSRPTRRSERAHGAEAPLRAAYLRFAALQHDLPALAGTLLDASPQPWTADWVCWQADAAHQILAQRSSVITALVATSLDGMPVAVTGDAAGRIEAWDLSTGALARELRPAHRARVTALARPRPKGTAPGRRVGGPGRHGTAVAARDGRDAGGAGARARGRDRRARRGRSRRHRCRRFRPCVRRGAVLGPAPARGRSESLPAGTLLPA